MDFYISRTENLFDVSYLWVHCTGTDVRTDVRTLISKERSIHRSPCSIGYCERRYISLTLRGKFIVWGSFTWLFRSSRTKIIFWMSCIGRLVSWPIFLSDFDRVKSNDSPTLSTLTYPRETFNLNTPFMCGSNEWCINTLGKRGGGYYFFSKI